MPEPLAPRPFRPGAPAPPWLRCACTLVAVGALLLLGACQPAEDGGDERETLRVLASEFAPFYYHDENGRTAGLEHLILQGFAGATGREIEPVWVDEFGQLFAALERGDGDLIAGSVTITEEREQRFDFSAPYFPVVLMLIEPRDAPSPGLASLPDKAVATIEGTTYEAILDERGVGELVYARNDEELFEVVAGGEAEALVTDSPNFLWFGRDFPGLRVTASMSERSFFGFGVRTGDPLKDELDRYLGEIIASGVYWDLVEQAFGEVVGEYLDDLRASEEGFLGPGR